MEPSGELALAAEFPTPDREQWLDLVQGVLRKSGADFGSLITTTYDGIAVQPLYTAGDQAAGRRLPGLRPVHPRRSAAGRGRGLGRTPAAPRSARPRGGARRPGERRHLAVAGNGPRIPATYCRGAGRRLPRPGAGRRSTRARTSSKPRRAMLRVWDQRARVAGERGARQPRRRPAGRAGPHRRRARRPGRGRPTCSALPAQFPGLRAWSSWTRLPYHEAGGSDAQELGASLAAGVAYLRAPDRGRAERRRRPCGSWSSATRPPPTSSSPSPSCAPPAGCGRGSPRSRGAPRRRAAPARGDVAGDDDPPRPVGEHAAHHRRLLRRRGRRRRRRHRAAVRRTRSACRTTSPAASPATPQSMLLEESHLARVIDPAGGSWYVERLTDELAARRVGVVPGDRAAGGLAAALASGLVARPARGHLGAPRGANLAHRTRPAHRRQRVPQPRRAAASTARARARRAAGGGLPPASRRAEAFEALRDPRRRAAGRDRRPARVFLAALGPVAAHTARATFAANLFEAGGIETP